MISDFRNDPLWKSISEYDLDGPENQIPFALRLARDNLWSVSHAECAVEEYKRFCYLAMRAGHMIAPSDAVDQVWHLHLLNTKSYWMEFCPNILGVDFHHHPNRGSRSDNKKINEAYKNTLTIYHNVFGYSPPREIWPDAKERFSDRSKYRRVNEADYWIIRKPKLRA